MEKERTIKMLLILLSQQEVHFRKSGCLGLCALINTLKMLDIISSDESIRLDEYILTECNKDFSYHHNIFFPWFFPLQEWEPRYEWLLSKIKTLE